VYPAGMDKLTKRKVEVYVTEGFKEKMEQICLKKGISLADALRRALEGWIKDESNSQSH
jgi:hypothetical protein